MMEANPLTIDASVYYHFASKDPSRWLAIQYQRVSHPTCGEGTITQILPHQTSQLPPTLWVRFDHPGDSPLRGVTPPKRFPLTALKDKEITHVTLPPDLADAARAFEQQLHREKAEEARKRKLEEQQAARQRAAEERRRLERREETRQDFQRLKEKYQIRGYSKESPDSWLYLYKILIELDEENSLSDADREWLESRELFQPIALYDEQNGELASAGSNWRKAGNPQRALEITADAKHHQNPANLTMRGGAHRDLEQLDDAETAARKAMNLDPQSYYPYNLLGAIYYQRGLPEEGERYFDQARELGSPQREKDKAIRSAVEKAEPAKAVAAAEYLLRKDPVRYEWARDYLRPSSL
jgi:tetratricopeptide (TPR) repeat protein